MRYRYSKWDGTQELLSWNEEDVMEGLSDHVLFSSDLERALRTMTWRGFSSHTGRHMVGIQDLLKRVQSRRKELLDKYDLGTAFENISHQLDEIVQKERAGIHRYLRELRNGLTSEEDGQSSESEFLDLQEQQAKGNLEFLDNLPGDVGSRIKGLLEYKFMVAEARRQFEELIERLKKRVLDTYFKDLSKRLKELSAEQMNRLKEMMRQLNRMLEQRSRGETPDFHGFMKQFGDAFGPNPPSSLEELLGQLAEQVAQMQSLLASLPAEMRQSLRDTLDAVLQDRELQNELSRFASALEEIVPMEGLRNRYGFTGEESISLEEAIKLMEHLQSVDQLEDQLRRARQAADLDEIDLDRLQDVLGEEARMALDRLKDLTDMLEQAGYIRKEGARLELTPRGIRRLGQKPLREIFRYLKKDRFGNHEVRRFGMGGEVAEGTKKYEFGDPFMVDLNKTLFNAVEREGMGTPLRLDPCDFEVHRTEDLTQCATVLMLDLSLSMAMRGSFLAAKRMAMALDSLMRTRFPRDRFFIVGFSTYAREVKPDQLPYLGWDEFDPYTNIQHGLILAQKLLSRVKWGNKQILLVSDGEPTAYLDRDHLHIQYPPDYRTMEMTLREVRNVTRRGIVINTFMLDTNPFLMKFVSELGRINRGRVFFTSPERLGEYVLVDYLSQKRK